MERYWYRTGQPPPGGMTMSAHEQAVSLAQIGAGAMSVGNAARLAALCRGADGVLAQSAPESGPGGLQPTRDGGPSTGAVGSTCMPQQAI